MDLKTEFDGLTFENPLMPAAGPLNGDLRKLRFLKEQGCGGIVTKTISTKEPHIPKPCIYGEKDRIMNSELWSEHPKETWIDSFLPGFHEDKDRPLIISVGYSKEDMEDLIPRLDRFADAFEVSTHYVGKDLSVIEATVRTIREHTEKPIYMKISPHIPDVPGFAAAIKKAGANGVVAINSLGPTMHIDVDGRRITYGNDSGFVWTSGPAIKPLALATVYQIKQAEPDLTVIGVGGIASADDVIEFMLAGADAVQMLSAALLKGKTLYKKIIADLPAALKSHGFSSIADVRAATLSNDVAYDAPLPRLDEDRCVECMICEKVCPYFAIEYKDKITFSDADCFRCGLCVSMCPTDAISME